MTSRQRVPKEYHSFRCRRLAFESFEPRQLLTTLVDLDGDGDLDVVGSLDTSDRKTAAEWYENTDGKGNFVHHSLDAERVEVLAVGDIDANGDLDLATPNAWYENLNGEFTARRIANAEGLEMVTDLRIEDFDGDGHSDLVALRETDFTVLPNVDGLANFPTYKTTQVGDIAAESRLVDLQDIDGDGDLDPILGFGSSYVERIDWYENQDSNYLLQATLAEGRDVSIEFVDLDGDNDLDAVITSIEVFDPIYDFRLNEPDSFGPANRLMAGDLSADFTRYIKDMRDIDGDGDADAHISDSFEPFFPELDEDYWLRNDDLNFVDCDCSFDREIREFGDINADGIPDGLSRRQTSQEVDWKDGDAAQSDIGKIDALQRSIRDQASPSNLDFNSDSKVDNQDFPVLLTEVVDSVWGDANLDGRFDSEDLTAVFQAGEYEDQLDGNSTWSEGDWDGDGDFSSSDLILVMQQGGFDQSFTVSGRRGIVSVTSAANLILGTATDNLIDGDTSIFCGIDQSDEFRCDSSVVWDWRGEETFQLTFDQSYDISEFRLWSRETDAFGRDSVSDFQLIFRDFDGEITGTYSGRSTGRRDGNVFDVGLHLEVFSVDFIIKSTAGSRPRMQEVAFRT